MDKTDNNLEKLMMEATTQKQRRKSSISSESIKLLQTQRENVQELILKVVDSQHQWLEHQLNRLNKRLNKSKSRADKTTACIVSVELDLNSSNSNESEHDLKLLSKDQQDYLRSTQIDFEMVCKNLKKIRQNEIKKQIENYHNDSAKVDSKHSFLSKNQSRLSISASCSAQCVQEKKDVFQLLNDYFDS